MAYVKNIILFVLIVSGVGCVAMGERFVAVDSPAPDKGVVYIYHPKDDAYGANEANFLFLGDEKIFRFTHNGYSYFTLQPGSYNFNIRLSTFYVATDLIRDSINLNVEAGKTYYIKYYEEKDKVEFWSTGTMAGASQLTKARMMEVNAPQALAELSTKRLLKHRLMHKI